MSSSSLHMHVYRFVQYTFTGSMKGLGDIKALNFLI